MKELLKILFNIKGVIILGLVNNFKEWLIASGKSLNTVKSISSRINRIKEEYSIEYEYEKDGCATLLDDFNYSQEDVENGILPKVHINIKGDYITGLRSLKRAIVLYTNYLNTTNRISQNEDNNLKSCIFEGNFSEFNKYTGPMWRNKIQIITRAIKNKVKVCECCLESNELHAAHKHGFERINVIKNILDKYFKISTDYYRVDLADFEQRFIEAHNHIEDIFYFLCQKCHQIYDDGDINQSENIEKTVLSNRKIN
jgi:hypothetical protein